MFSEEHFNDDETGKALVLAAYHNINRRHVKGYCTLAFGKPDDLTEKVRREAMDSLFAFANLGWSAFHVMNKGQPLKDPPKKSRAKKKPTKKPK